MTDGSPGTPRAGAFFRLARKLRSVCPSSKTAEAAPRLRESDYLLGVYDGCRMGALRFCTEKGGAFLDNDTAHSAPPLTASQEEMEPAFRLPPLGLCRE